ncbi:MAG TPA: aminotransferase class I/II-fold pyridoxal phosphate-dependent enzyme [Gemmatimonadaceae bacterium]
MSSQTAVSRRTFVGGVATAVGALGLPPLDLWAQGTPTVRPRDQRAPDEYDALAKLANNENPYGPSETVIQAMTKAFKYANRYGYPDGNVTEEIAKHHGVKQDQVMIAAGSGEILDVCCTALLQDGRKIVGSEPSYTILYQNAAGLKADTIKIPLLADFRQDIPALIRATKKHHREVGFVYLCNPNNPTGRIVTKDEVRELLDGIPEDVPVLIDEAYHHFVEDPAYATSMPYVHEGRAVIVARTFSKIAGLAGMRLGYAVASREQLQVLRAYATGSVNACVRWGGAAALADKANEDKVRRVTLALRKKTVADLKALGYESIPSETNFFMVHLKRPIVPVIEEFRKKGVLVGRPFPPLNEHLRVSIGTPDEIARFMVAFREIMTSKAASNG